MLRVMNAAAERLIAQLGLVPLPHEGGFFRRTWTSSESLPNGRSAGSAIYFLLTETDFSALHRMPTDELWFFHAGDVVEHVQLNGSEPGLELTRMGGDLMTGQAPQLIVPGGTWQGARLAPPLFNESRNRRNGWALMSCTMAPAWDEQEFVLGNRPGLLREFPKAAPWIEVLTR